MIKWEKNFETNRLGLANHAENQPDRPAVILNDRITIFLELDRNTNALATAFLDLGISPGDRIAVLFHNSLELIEAWIAAAKISATPLFLNYRFREEEIAYILNDSESRLLLFGSEFEDLVEKALRRFKGSLSAIVCSGSASMAGALSLGDLVSKGPTSPPNAGLEAHGVSPGVHILNDGKTERGF